MRRRRGAGRGSAGFTLIEVVVCVAVIGILALLMLTAVQAARGSSRRLACLNHLKQIGVALHSYAATIGGFPPGTYGWGYSVHAMLLPYVDQVALYNAINFQVGARRSGLRRGRNATAFRQPLALFTCPEDRDVRPSGACNYAGNRGSGVQRFGYNGAFSGGIGGIVPLGAFRDGASNTLAFAEWLVGPPNPPARREPRRLVFATNRALTAPHELDDFARACAAVDPARGSLAPLTKGESWLLGEFWFTLYNHVLGINGNSCTNETLVQEGAWTAGSLHCRGANAIFADGHARFLADSLDVEVWRALGSRDGGESLPADLP